MSEGVYITQYISQEIHYWSPPCYLFLHSLVSVTHHFTWSFRLYGRLSHRVWYKYIPHIFTLSIHLVFFIGIKHIYLFINETTYKPPPKWGG